MKKKCKCGETENLGIIRLGTTTLDICQPCRLKLVKEVEQFFKSLK